MGATIQPKGSAAAALPFVHSGAAPDPLLFCRPRAGRVHRSSWSCV